MLAVWKYSLLRLALFGGCLAVLLLVQVPALLALVFAALISSALSYLLLRRQRDELVAVIDKRVQARMPAPGTSDAEVEDAEAAQAEAAPRPDPAAS